MAVGRAFKLPADNAEAVKASGAAGASINAINNSVRQNRISAVADPLINTVGGGVWRQS